MLDFKECWIWGDYWYIRLIGDKRLYYLSQFHPYAAVVAGLAGGGSVEDAHGGLAAKSFFQGIVDEDMVKGMVSVAVFVIDGPRFSAGIPWFQTIQAGVRFRRSLDNLHGTVRGAVIEVPV